MALALDESSLVTVMMSCRGIAYTSIWMSVLCLHAVTTLSPEKSASELLLPRVSSSNVSNCSAVSRRPWLTEPSCVLIISQSIPDSFLGAAMDQRLIAANLSTRGFPSPLHLHRRLQVSLKHECTGGVHVRTAKKFPCLRSANPSISHACLASASGDDVLLSSQEFPDGSILFRFGSPDEQPSNIPKSAENGSISTSESQEPTDVPIVQAGTQAKLGKAAESESHSDEVPSEEGRSSTHEQDSEVAIEADSSLMTSRQETEKRDDDHVVAKQESTISGTSIFEAEERSEEPYRLHSGAAMQPHPSKAATGGEDAYFIEGTTWVGVADGVGGWALDGIDSGLYSRELMSNCAKLTKLEDGVPDPKRVITKGVEKSTAIGTCTATVAALHKQTLYVANIGDSGFLVVRDGKMLAKSKPMQRGFNFPYQIGSQGDNPSMAETFEVAVTSGDILVLATDGVFDNLYESHIVNAVQAAQARDSKPEELASLLVKNAHAVGCNNQGRSPFSDAAMAAGYTYTGGKLDDATVVVSYIE